MKKIIKVAPPVYTSGNAGTVIGLSTTDGAKADLIIDFDKLLPFANSVKSEVMDFFILSASVYGIDRFIERRRNSIDGWSRELSVTFPVTDTAKWKPLKTQMEFVLSFLTGDYWEIDFYQSSFKPPVKAFESQHNETFSTVSLLSGGLDSLIGAIDFLKTHSNEKILFVSHYDSQMNGPKGDQIDLINEFNKLYPDLFAAIPAVKVSLESTTLPRETTFRSRSILFIGMALLAAQGKRIEKIMVPENGSVSLNFPLSPSRRSSCSTRTTHPTVLENLQSVFTQLGIKCVLTNPYEFKTKGEMVRECCDQTSLKKIIPLSNSCGKRGHRAHWEEPSATHCGVCMPCVYRRASLLSISDKTTYGSSLNTLSWEKQKGQDVGACLEYLNSKLTKQKIKEELIVNGLRNLEKVDRYSEVVVRTRDEIMAWVRVTGSIAVKKKAGIK